MTLLFGFNFYGFSRSSGGTESGPADGPRWLCSPHSPRSGWASSASAASCTAGRPRRSSRPGWGKRSTSAPASWDTCTSERTCHGQKRHLPTLRCLNASVYGPVVELLQQIGPQARARPPSDGMTQDKSLQRKAQRAVTIQSFGMRHVSGGKKKNGLHVGEMGLPPPPKKSRPCNTCLLPSLGYYQTFHMPHPANIHMHAAARPTFLPDAHMSPNNNLGHNVNDLQKLQSSEGKCVILWALAAEESSSQNGA